jgi:MoaA/NifB/PqqE/SkfB family radical SAM enzyme
MKDVYTKLKFLRFREQLDALENGHIAPPVHVRIKPMNPCDHDCWYCAYHVDNLQLGNLMEYKDKLPREKMLEIVDDLAEMGVQAVTFSGGGEPLIYPHIAEAVNKLGRSGIKVATLTNGSHLHKDIAEAFARYGTWIRVSIDGWGAESYAKIRNVKLTEFDLVINNMRNFANLNSSCVLGVNYVIDNENYSHVFEFSKLMKDVGVNHLKIMGVLVSNEGADCNDYHEKIRGTVQEQIIKARGLEDEKFKIIDHYHEFPERFDKEYVTCPSLQFLTIIGADSKVYSCHDKAYTELGLLGSIENRRFKDFWYSEENKKRMQEINPSIHCQHHCSEHKRNLLLHEYMSVDQNHLEFV